MGDGGFAWAPVLGRLVSGDDLEPNDVSGAMATILRGEAQDAQIAAFLVALRAKGETVDELTALVRTAREFGERVDVAGPLVDTCGTGGDRLGTFNVSTTAAFVVAGAGARVCKHGNRAASSQSGSADVLEALGVAVDLGPKGVARCIDEVGMGFCLAQRFHPAFRYAAPVRAALGIPTTFNFLGPLANPAGVTRQALGVSDPAMAARMVGALEALGSQRALIFWGHDGLDELTTTGPSTVVELNGEVVDEYEIDPEEFGLPRATIDDLAGGTPMENADITRRVLAGEAGPHRDIVVLNAAAGLLAADVAANFGNAVSEAAAAIDDGLAAERLESLIAVSQAARADDPAS